MAKKPGARLADFQYAGATPGAPSGKRARRFDLAAIDPRAKPFSSGDKAADQAAVDALAERHRPAAGHALRRPPLQDARRPAGHRHERQGRHDPRRVLEDERARRPHRGVEGALRGGARARLPVAHPPEGAGRRRDRDLQPQPLRGRPRSGGQGLDHARGDGAALRPHQRLREAARRDRHRRPQVPPPHLEGRAARSACRTGSTIRPSTGSSRSATSRSAPAGTPTRPPTPRRWPRPERRGRRGRSSRPIPRPIAT